jgi:nucleotide-binding universal stress UspA family protein
MLTKKDWNFKMLIIKSEKMKKVLIALDYDVTAQKIAEAGFSFAKSMKAQVILLHVIGDPAYYSSLEYSPITGFAGYMDMTNNQLDSIEGLLKASQLYLDKTKQHLGDKKIKTYVKEGDFAPAILSTAKELHADMIVMGSHSRNWLDNIVMGSVTEKVLHGTPVPLLIIPVKK